jgi:glutamate--cysteine ligase
MSVVTRDTATGALRDCAAVQGYVERVCFKTGPPTLVGAELEWLVAFADDPTQVVPIELLRRALDDRATAPNGSSITFEPGGQLELSSLPATSPAGCWRALQLDLEHVRRRLAGHGLELLRTAIDPVRPPLRQLSHPRYTAMEAYFAAIGTDLGAVMMNSTAAVQVNLDIGNDPVDAGRRWRLLHTIGPAMIASFANSPVHAGRATGWKSARQQVWQNLDPQRTRAPSVTDPMPSWSDYALDAQLMLLRRADGDWALAPSSTFRDWIDGRPGAGFPADAPTIADLEYHLTTLFPPVRPRGWLEVRYIDAQPLKWWPVPMAVLSALVEDLEASSAASTACESVIDAWETAAHIGLDDPGLAAAAIGCFEAATAAMSGSDSHPGLVDLVKEFAETFVLQGRCPADDGHAPIREAP